MGHVSILLDEMGLDKMGLDEMGINHRHASATKVVVSCCAYGCIIALGNDMDLVFIGFQLFPWLEGRNGSEQ